MTDLAMMFPEIPLADIEAKAQKLLDDYEAHVGLRIQAPIPVESIAEHYLGYQIDITDGGLFEDPRYLGGIVFDENVIRVNASVESHEGRYNFTIAHEIGHHVLHRDQYLAERDAEHPGIMCREFSARPLVEKQADQFASALLMPAELIRRAAEQVIIPSGEMSVRALRVTAGKVIRAGRFTNVSNTAMANRLIELGYAKGVDYQTGTGLDLLRVGQRSLFYGPYVAIRGAVRRVRKMIR